MGPWAALFFGGGNWPQSSDFGAKSEFPCCDVVDTNGSSLTMFAISVAVCRACSLNDDLVVYLFIPNMQSIIKRIVACFYDSRD